MRASAFGFAACLAMTAACILLSSSAPELARHVVLSLAATILVTLALAYPAWLGAALWRGAGGASDAELGA